MRERPGSATGGEVTSDLTSRLRSISEFIFVCIHACGVMHCLSFSSFFLWGLRSGHRRERRRQFRWAVSENVPHQRCKTETSSVRLKDKPRSLMTTCRRSWRTRANWFQGLRVSSTTSRGRHVTRNPESITELITTIYHQLLMVLMSTLTVCSSYLQCHRVPERLLKEGLCLWAVCSALQVQDQGTNLIGRFRPGSPEGGVGKKQKTFRIIKSRVVLSPFFMVSVENTGHVESVECSGGRLMICLWFISPPLLLLSPVICGWGEVPLLSRKLLASVSCPEPSARTTAHHLGDESCTWRTQRDKGTERLDWHQKLLHVSGCWLLMKWYSCVHPSYLPLYFVLLFLFNTLFLH